MLEDEVTTKPPNNGDASKPGSGQTKMPPDVTLKDPTPNFSARPAAAAQTKTNGDSNPDLSEILRDRQEELLVSIAQPPRLRKLWQRVWRRNHPELLHVYGIIYNNLDEVQRLLTERSADPPDGFDRVERQLRCLLARGYEHSRDMDIHAAWEFAGSLERALLLLGDDHFIITRLESEQEREQKKQPGSWSTYLAIEKLEELLKDYQPGDATGLRARAVECLAFLYQMRTGYMRKKRTREELRADYLNRLTLVLTLLLLLLLEAIYIADAGGGGRFSQGLWGLVKMVFTLDIKLDLSSAVVRSALVAAMTGALGSTLSGFYKLRDETGGIATLRSFRSAMWAQPFVGATVGVLLMLLIMSGVLAIGTTGGTSELKWLTLAVYCFLAGFSEPFFLGVVQRVAGAADNKPATVPAAASKDDKKTP